MWCSQCGHEIPAGARFCAYCGKQVSPSSAAPSAQTAVSQPSDNERTKNSAVAAWIIAALMTVAVIILVLVFVVFPSSTTQPGQIIASPNEPVEVEELPAPEPSEVPAETPAEPSAAPSQPASETADVPEPQAQAALNGTGFNRGDVLYDFEAKAIDGSVFRLSDELGKPVFINFFATWCPPCVGEMPDIQALYDEYGNDVSFIVVGLGEPSQTIADYAAQNSYTLPFAYDEDGTVWDNYTVEYIPQTFVVAADGTIVQFFSGETDQAAFEAAITSALQVSP